MAHKIGPKELQRIALRERRYDERGPGARRHSKALARMKPDTSDIPEASEAWFKNAKLKMPKAPAAAQPKETTMKKAKKTIKAKAKTPKRTVSQAAANLKAAKAKTAKPSTDPVDKSFTVRPGSKLAIVVGLLTREGGCTAKEILEQCGWPTVSVPQQARAAGLSLRKVKDGKVSRYFGTVPDATS